jgi:hypothetical protein
MSQVETSIPDAQMIVHIKKERCQEAHFLFQTLLLSLSNSVRNITEFGFLPEFVTLPLPLRYRRGTVA